MVFVIINKKAKAKQVFTEKTTLIPTVHSVISTNHMAYSVKTLASSSSLVSA